MPAAAPCCVRGGADAVLSPVFTFVCYAARFLRQQRGSLKRAPAPAAPAKHLMRDIRAATRRRRNRRHDASCHRTCYDSASRFMFYTQKKKKKKKKTVRSTREAQFSMMSRV